jgi:hypothetical protein
MQKCITPKKGKNMIIKSKISPHWRKQLLIALGPLAWLAFLASIVLERLGNPDLDFLIGFLTGFSIVGNLVYIYVMTRHLRNIRRP